LPFLGYFFNKPTKSSLIGEKSPNLVTLVSTVKSFIRLARQFMKEFSVSDIKGLLQ